MTGKGQQWHTKEEEDDDVAPRVIWNLERAPGAFAWSLTFLESFQN